MIVEPDEYEFANPCPPSMTHVSIGNYSVVHPVWHMFLIGKYSVVHPVWHMLV